MISRYEIEATQPNTLFLKEDVIARCLDGKFLMHMSKWDKSLTPSIAEHGYWESWITAYIANNVRDKFFLDLGANCGYYSLLASAFGAADVHAFEPNPRYVRLLRKSAWENDFKIAVHEVAVSDKNGPVALNLFGDLDGGASIVTPSEVHLDALSTTLDRWYTFNGMFDEKVLMKVDVEGAEELVIDGAESFFNENKVTMVMEYTPGAYSDKFWDKLQDLGSINVLNYAGQTQAITRAIAERAADWITLVVRNY